MAIRLLLLIPFISLIYSATAQSKAVPDTYDRNGLSVVYVNYTDAYDNTLKSAFERLQIDEKFDRNLLPLNSIKVKHKRGEAEQETRRKNIEASMRATDYGKQVLSYLFNRKSTGKMDIERILSRGHYNASDVQVMKAESTVRGLRALGESGFELIANNYILVTDIHEIKQKKDKEDKTTWSAKVDGYLYQIRYDRAIEDEFFRCWIYDSDTKDEASRKISSYERLNVGLKHVATVSTSVSIKQDKDKYSQQNALKSIVSKSHDELVTSLENRVEQWAVKSSISATKPIRAKIGTKEGLKNAKRFDVYEYYAQQNGDIYSKRKGIIRATKIARNSQLADKNSPSSEFYQIAGSRLEPGMTLRQKNDLGLGVGFAYRMEARSGYFLTMDWLAHIHTKGTSHYALLELGFNNVNVGKSSLWDESVYAGTKRLSVMDVGIGYGLGLRLVRQFELVPHLLLGFETILDDPSEFPDHVNLNETDKEKDDAKFWDKSALYFTLGMKFNLTFAYPLQLFGGIDYSFYGDYGDTYRSGRELFDSSGNKRKGTGYHIGLRINF